MSSSEILMENDKHSMALKLSELGYDVWLGNNRGNIYSRGHTTMDAEKDYFRYSFVEFGKYDIIAQVEHAKSISNSTGKVTYVGHSFGTTQMFAALSQNFANIKDHVNHFVALGPVAKLDHI